jgi:Tol biopolymer transport system component
MLRKGIVILVGSFVLLLIGSAYAQVPMVAFLSDRSGDQEIYLMFNNGDVEQLTKAKARTTDFDWSPDGQTIAFTSNIRGGESFEIYTIDVENKDQTDLMQGKLAGIWQLPRWSPTGEKRLLVESLGGLPNALHWDVGVLDFEEDDLVVFNVANAAGEGEGQDREATWSPDGTQIVFHGGRVAWPRGAFDIVIADMTTKKPGVDQVLLTKHDAGDQRARWSRDGAKILFESNRDGDWEIFVMDADGENLKQLTENDETDRNAEWSKSSIVFESKRDGDWEIYGMGLDGNDQTNLTNDPGKDANPLLSPNGEKVLFESRRDKNTELYLVDTDGGAVKNLTNNPEKDYFGRWNPVYFLHPVEPQDKHFTTFGAIKRTSLMQNFPNPFNPETWIPYYLAEDASVTVRIYNVKGQLIRSIDAGKQTAGVYTNRQRAAYWDGKDNTGQSVVSGIYFYQLLADDFSETRRMVVMK